MQNLCGIDEAGRGPLAGPLVVAGVILEKEIFNVDGHTIFPEPKINNFSAGIDLGCFHKKDSFKIPNPRLCALEFPSMKLYIQNSLENN